MKIETEFGKIIVDGKTYNQDILIDVNGKLLARTDISMRYYGSHHTICREEVKDLIEEQKPEYLIIGTGQYGACRLEESIPKICERNNIKLIMKKTPEAIKDFMNLPGKKLGLFHVTC
jgi:hypothetical protein